jgi:hypothetical protein
MFRCGRTDTEDEPQYQTHTYRHAILYSALLVLFVGKIQLKDDICSRLLKCGVLNSEGAGDPPHLRLHPDHEEQRGAGVTRQGV